MNDSENSDRLSGLALDQARYRFLVEHSGEMISAHRPGDWAYTSVNPAITDIAGYQPEEVLGKSAYDYYHPEDAEAMKNKLIPAIRRHGIRTFRYRHRSKDGSYQWVESTHRSIRDSQSGELQEIIAVTRDITPQVKAEQALREHQAELAHLSRLMSMGEMATGLAHEINQPLATTLNYANGALRILHSGKPLAGDKLKNVLEAIVKQSQRAAEIVKRLRGLVKKTPYQRSVVELSSLCREVGGFLKHELWELGAEIDFELEDAVEIEADRIQIEQVLVNLLRNAIEAYRDSSVRRRVIRINLSCDAQKVELSVSDFAGGIGRELQQKLFDPYVTSKTEGLGMGLSITRSIIEAHGGQIWVESDAEHWTKFRVSLPSYREAGAS